MPRFELVPGIPSVSEVNAGQRFENSGGHGPSIFVFVKNGYVPYDVAGKRFQAAESP